MGTPDRGLRSIHGLESLQNIRKTAEEAWKYIYVSILKAFNLLYKSAI